MLALVVSAVLVSVVLLIAGHDPIDAFRQMWEFGTQGPQLVNILNKSASYYLAALAVNAHDVMTGRWA